MAAGERKEEGRREGGEREKKGRGRARDKRGTRVGVRVLASTRVIRGADMTGVARDAAPRIDTGKQRDRSHNRDREALVLFLFFLILFLLSATHASRVHESEQLVTVDGSRVRLGFRSHVKLVRSDQCARQCDRLVRREEAPLRLIA